MTKTYQVSAEASIEATEAASSVVCFS